MSGHPASITLCIALALTSQVSITTPAFGQNSVSTQDPTPKTLQGEIEAVKAENAQVRELLRTLEEHQKLLMEQIARLQQRLDAGEAADVSAAGQVPPAIAAAGTTPAGNPPSNPPPIGASGQTASLVPPP